MRLSIDKTRLKALPEDERVLAEEAIRELEHERQNNPLAFYRPHTKQVPFHSFTASTKCFFGGNQSGKTTAGLADDVIQAVDRDSLPEHLKQFKHFEPPFLCRIMAPSFPVLETTLYQKLQELLPVDQLMGGSWSKAFDKNLRVLHFANGSKFFFQTYEMDVAKMGGATLDRVHFDEEPPWRVFNECAMRVMVRSGDLVFTMTPVEGLTWTFEALWKKRGEETATDVFEAPDLQVVTVDMDDNPALSEKDKALRLAGMSKEERTARKEGRFVALHGLIYADFSRSRHVVPERPVPPNVNVVVGIDPGMRNRAAVTWAYLQADDAMVVFEEGYYEGMTVRQVCEAVHKVNARFEIAPLYYVIDPAARNKNHQTGRSDQMEYADHGIVTIAGQNSVRAGINRVKERFQTDRLFIQAHCVHLVDELEKYRWKDPPRSGEDGRDAPVKKDDHLLDGLRYLISSRPYLPDVSDARTETEVERLMREDQERFARPEETNIAQFGGIAA